MVILNICKFPDSSPVRDSRLFEFTITRKGGKKETYIAPRDTTGELKAMWTSKTLRAAAMALKIPGYSKMKKTNLKTAISREAGKRS